MKRVPFTFLVLSLLSCGGSSSIRVDVDLAVNQTGNPLLQIDKDFKAGLSSGIYFKFEPLNCPPSSISDIGGGTTVTSPELSDPNGGSSPLEGSYSFATSLLSPTKYYKVTMLAMNNPPNPLTRTITHIGVGDCPINVALGDSNRSTICFGANIVSNLPFCPGTTVFEQCPGISQSLCY